MKTAQDYAESCLKPPKSFFDWCYYQIPTFIWANKNKKIVASDKKHIHTIKKRLTKNSRLSFFHKEKFFQIILCSSKRIEKQTYSICSFIEDGKQRLTNNLVSIQVLQSDECIFVSASNNGGYYFGKLDFGIYHPSITFYENGYEDKLIKKSELKYLQLKYISSDKLDHVYKYRDVIEYVEKIHARGLISDLYGNRVDMRRMTMKKLKSNKSFLKNSDVSSNEFLLKYEITSRGIKYVPGIGNYMQVSDLNKLPKNIGLLKLQNYLLKQEKQFQYYKDYRDLLEELGIETTSKNVIWPKNLERSHDEAVNSLNAIKDIERARSIEEKLKNEAELSKKILENRSHFEMTIGNYIFVLPKTPYDLINEGRCLMHCVGGRGYIEGHFKGSTSIVFIREKNKLDTPFFTMEYKDKVIQVRGMKNCDPSKELKKVVDKWVELVKEKNKQAKLHSAA
ncbi:hypothetical protein BG261_02960 [Floricoccus tropicus]|uniref:PcfJ-like protein n=1 Tax=Floricoccus tropicus TaxID=1859473 RepID=A0A1E8GMT4_9LACT|nr:PcfJ domain-containing protein [Floricoccus tropicus]OFI49555.1 hypothetical protein BG261_02960 [Floricoccus tropicus]